MPTEFFGALDCTGRKTGRTIPRDEAHRTGTWHGAFHCLFIYQRDGLNYALFQLRSVQKLIAPGKFDVSVGGHYATGENAEVAGPREIKEELGLDVLAGRMVAEVWYLGSPQFYFLAECIGGKFGEGTGHEMKSTPTSK